MATTVAPYSEVTLPSLFDHVGPWTVDDLDIFDEHHHVEIDNGALVMAPHPAVDHNKALTKMLFALMRACPPHLDVATNNGVAFAASYRIPDGTVHHKVPRGRQRLLPDDVVLAFEVVSPSSTRIDRRDKLEDYASIDIAHYWIVELDPEPMLVVYALRGGAYEEIARVRGDETYEATEPFPVNITPSQLLG